MTTGAPGRGLCGRPLRVKSALRSMSRLVGCGFVSGLFARPQPLALMDCPPPRDSHFDFALTGACPRIGYVSGRRSDWRSINLLRLALAKATLGRRQALVDGRSYYAACSIGAR